MTNEKRKPIIAEVSFIAIVNDVEPMESYKYFKETLEEVLCCGIDTFDVKKLKIRKVKP